MQDVRMWCWAPIPTLALCGLNTFLSPEVTVKSLWLTRKRLKVPESYLQRWNEGLCEDHGPFSFTQTLCMRWVSSHCCIWLWSQCMTACNAVLPTDSVAADRKGCMGKQTYGKSFRGSRRQKDATTSVFNTILLIKGLRLYCCPCTIVMSHLGPVGTAHLAGFGHFPSHLSHSAESLSAQLLLMQEQFLTCEH